MLPFYSPWDDSNPVYEAAVPEPFYPGLEDFVCSLSDSWQQERKVAFSRENRHNYP
jgi:hypothetical protein